VLTIRDRKRSLFLCFAGSVLAANYWIITHYSGLSYGPTPEWPLAVDLLLMLPAVYLCINRDRLRQALTGAAVIAGFGILAGSLMLPAESKYWWIWLENLRYLALLVLVLTQGTLIGLLILETKRAPDTVNIEVAANAAMQRRLGASVFSRLLQLEMRMWIYAVLRKPVRTAFPGTLHFGTHLQNGNASNQQGFLIIVGAEIPVLHGLLVLFGCPAAIAWTITALSLYGFIFLLAEYRASLLRPISVDQQTLYIRHGILGDLNVPLAQIESIGAFQGKSTRSTKRLRFFGAGAPNVQIRLRAGTTLPGLFGVSEIDEILLGVDDVHGFVVHAEAFVEQQRRS